MSQQKTVVGRFWSRVFSSPDAPAMIIKNDSTEPMIFPVHGSAGSGMGGVNSSGVVVVPAKPYVEISYAAMGRAVAVCTAALRQAGFKKGDRGAILAWNCAEWLIADLAIQTLGGSGITVPIYPHSTPEQVNYVLKDCGARFICSNDPAQLAKADPNGWATPVHFDEIPARIEPSVAGTQRPFMSWFTRDQGEAVSKWAAIKQEFAIFKAELEKENFCGITDDDVATIIYTSGSTGAPKGAILTHGNFAAACRGMLKHGFDLKPKTAASLGEEKSAKSGPSWLWILLSVLFFPITILVWLVKGLLSDKEGDVYLSYLPLAHVYERVAGALLCLYEGVPIAFCQIDQVGQALKDIRPTCLHGVPAVWRKIHEKITTEMMSATGLQALIALRAFKGKLPESTEKALEAGIHKRTPGFWGDTKDLLMAPVLWLADKLVPHKLALSLAAGKIRRGLGGRLRLCTSGGAPISRDILEFFQLAGLEVLQGYGLTETTGANLVNRPSSSKAAGGKSGNRIGTVGHPIPGVEIMLYREPGMENDPQGEIWIRGPFVFKGYWNNPEETAKSLTADGWFKTGDLGVMDADGFITITGRKKRLLKTDGGKYVAPEKIEKAFEGEPLVEYVVPVGDGKPFIAGLIFVSQAKAKALLGAAGEVLPLGGDMAAFIAAHSLVVKGVEQAVAAANAKLERWETLKKFKILPVEATVDAGLITLTRKIRTEEVLKHFKSDIEAFYKK